MNKVGTDEMDGDIYISFIMPAKNAETFIVDAINGVKRQTINNWELIIIEDNSEDDTFEIASSEAIGDHRINVYRNIGRGKVVGLNYGYTFAKGEIIKCIDSDDVLHRKFIEYCMEYNFEALCHSFFAVSSNMELKGINDMDSKFLNNDFNNCLKNVMGLPRWTWTVNRSIADKIFPMPEELPYEDIWFSLIIKRFANNIVNIKTALYYYRQHSDQTYGGIYNYTEDLIIYRTKRKLKVLNIVENKFHENFGGSSNFKVERESRKYLETKVKKNVSISEIIKLNTSTYRRIKLLLLRKAPGLITFIKKTENLKSKIVNKKKVHANYRDGLGIIN